jgi:hypothetical protein
MSVALLSGQRVLSIELAHEIKTIKYYEGDAIDFKLVGEKDFQNDRIEKILVTDGVVIFERMGMLGLDRIVSIRRKNITANAISKMLMSFGTVWIGYGLIAASVDRFDFDATTAAIGGTAIGVGYLTYKVAGYKKYKVGSRVRYRLLDLSIK